MLLVLVPKALLLYRVYAIGTSTDTIIYRACYRYSRMSECAGVFVDLKYSAPLSSDLPTLSAGIEYSKQLTWNKFSLSWWHIWNRKNGTINNIIVTENCNQQYNTLKVNNSLEAFKQCIFFAAHIVSHRDDDKLNNVKTALYKLVNCVY